MSTSMWLERIKKSREERKAFEEIWIAALKKLHGKG